MIKVVTEEEIKKFILQIPLEELIIGPEQVAGILGKDVQEVRILMKNDVIGAMKLGYYHLTTHFHVEEYMKTRNGKIGQIEKCLETELKDDKK